MINLTKEKLTIETDYSTGAISSIEVENNPDFVYRLQVFGAPSGDKTEISLYLHAYRIYKTDQQSTVSV